MIVLDTNVLSEPMSARPDSGVLGWLSSPRRERVAITAVSVGEILSGVRMIPAGRRREGLMEAVEKMLGARSDHILDYDERAACIYAELLEVRRAAGHPLSVEDGMIAAICRVHDASLATRNTRDFAGLGVTLIDPWSAVGG